MQRQLAFAVAPLVFGHGGIGAPVEFQVELTHPPGGAAQLFAALVKLGLQVLEVGDQKVHFGHRYAGNALFQPTLFFQILPGGATAAVAEAKSKQHMVCVFLLLEPIPGTNGKGSVDLAHVGGDPAVLMVGSCTPGGNKAGKDLCAVNALPPEGVHR